VKVGTVENRLNLPFDLGIYVVAHLFRMGAFGDADAERLWDDLPEIEERFLDLPLFRAVKNSGSDLVSSH
jgi:hypothetical protein